MQMFQPYKLALLLLTPISGALAQTDLFVYDAKAPLDYQQKLLEERDGIKIFDASYAGSKGGRVPVYLVVPSGKGPFAGIIFQHGGDQSRLTYLSEAVLLARSGAVSFITDIDFPDPDPAKWEQFRGNYITMVINLRRALDLMLSRDDVDKNRIAYVGHSYGAMLGGILTATEKRIKTFVLLGGLASTTHHIRTSPWWQRFRSSVPADKLEEYLAALKVVDPAEYIGRSAPATLLIQCGSYDEGVPPPDCRGLYEAAGAPKEIKWYACNHDFHDLDAILDRMKWVRDKLSLQPLSPAFRIQLQEK